MSFKVKSIYEYSSPHDDDLSFSADQIITVTQEEDADWYIGEYPDSDGTLRTGLFPKNFVEKYEPEVPTRPARPARQKSATQTPSVNHPPAEPERDDESLSQPTIVPVPMQEPQQATITHQEQTETPPTEPARPPSPPAPQPAQTAPSELDTPTPAPQPPTSSPPKSTPAKGPPPPVTEKSSSFKDRIAAFNRESKPVKPIDPRTISNNNARKPFVPPPPSRDAYIPILKTEPVQTKIYRREEDPEILERQRQDQQAAKDAGLAAQSDQPADDGQGAPKPTSLKERIALLQAQQREQAERAAELANKEKPPKPVKKGSQSSVAPQVDAPRGHSMDRVGSNESTDPVAVPYTNAEHVPDADARSVHSSQDGVEDAHQTHVADDTDAQPMAASAINVTVPQPEPIPAQATDVGDEEDSTEAEVEETEEDAETRRRLELRERMAKMSGGMGMAGMFGAGPPMGMPSPAQRPRATRAPRSQHDDADPAQHQAQMAPVPVMPQMIMATKAGNAPSRDGADADDLDDRPDRAESQTDSEPRRSISRDRSLARASSQSGRTAPPPIPSQRPAPPLPPAESRATPNSPPTMHSPPIPTTSRLSADLEGTSLPTRGAPPPIPVPPTTPHRGRSLQSVQQQASSPLRAPDEGQSEYEGDYDTDIGSSDKHKDALRSHVRDRAMNRTMAEDESSERSSTPAASPPPPLPRVPPLPPVSSLPDRTRESIDAPRAAPPPVPPITDMNSDEPEEYESTSTPAVQSRGLPPPPPSHAPPPRAPLRDDVPEESSDDLYRGAMARKTSDRRSIHDRVPPPPPPQTASPRVSESGPPQRQSTDGSRTTVRRSLDVGRPSNDGYIATDVDLGQATQWWAHEGQVPPTFSGRNDILLETEQTSTSKRGGKTTISKDVYVLFQDYSQTVVTAQYDNRDVADASLEQRHVPPPARLRQDQLESYWQKYGVQVAQAANIIANKKEYVVGDGSPHALILEIFQPLQNALRPVGTRAYGALVYANLANASVQQFDEIRPGDIITLRNARLQGKHGGLHTKYSMDVGSTAQGGAGHVAIVVEWDGTKKKIKALGQGGEKSKARIDGFRLADLKSGEVRVWRIVGREWIGWDTSDESMRL